MSGPLDPFTRSTYEHLTVAEDELKNMSTDEIEKALSKVRLSSRAVVKMSRSKDEANFLIHGSPQEMKRARNLIRTQFERKRPVTTITFEIPTRRRSAVVGPKGSTARSIKRKHNVEITIARKRFQPHYSYSIPEEIRYDDLVWRRMNGINFAPTVQVNVTGNETDCLGAKASISEIVLLEVEDWCYFPHGIGLCADMAMEKVKECLGDSIRLGRYFGCSNKVAVQGDKDLVSEAMRTLRSYANLFCDSVIVPYAFRERDFQSCTQNVDICSVHENGTEKRIFIKGHESDVISTREKISKCIATYFSQRLVLADLHGGNIEHVKMLLSLDDVRYKFSCCCLDNNVVGELPSSGDLYDVEFIEVFGPIKLDVTLAIRQLQSILKRMKPSDFYFCSDEKLIWKLQVKWNLFNRALSDDTMTAVVSNGTLLLYGKHLSCGHASQLPSNIEREKAFESLRQWAGARSKVVLDVPLKYQALLELNFVMAAINGDPFECKIFFRHDGVRYCKDKITLFGTNERVEKTVALVKSILQSEEEQGICTEVIEVPSRVVPAISYDSRVIDRFEYGVKPHIVRKDGLPNRPTWLTSASDVSLVTLKGNRVLVDAYKKDILDNWSPHVISEMD
ncbi:uncharacterized protein CXQ87_001546 [Candidozyma duobushaemuli]|uniref:K Homology domain-containing protein n=2 Tax=Candidozyma TaxID=3303203 RepID=A0ABX8I739_9ASCO|nr:uncharacterized protein CXQ87_001546 [[Candida] duobushaemulonis]PVH13442.1 hypothetical protein CXQ87_001546 [[Candida] duobushaemulonis]QWU88313.1 hypothetical protein CA3LBN_002578 [[Candida] haemuloni]